jgi:hypothetical protein
MYLIEGKALFEMKFYASIFDTTLDLYDTRRVHRPRTRMWA